MKDELSIQLEQQAQELIASGHSVAGYFVHAASSYLADDGEGLRVVLEVDAILRASHARKMADLNATSVCQQAVITSIEKKNAALRKELADLLGCSVDEIRIPENGI